MTAGSRHARRKLEFQVDSVRKCHAREDVADVASAQTARANENEATWPAAHWSARLGIPLIARMCDEDEHVTVLKWDLCASEACIG